MYKFRSKTIYRSWNLQIYSGSIRTCERKIFLKRVWTNGCLKIVFVDCSGIVSVKWASLIKTFWLEPDISFYFAYLISFCFHIVNTDTYRYSLVIYRYISLIFHSFYQFFLIVFSVNQSNVCTLNKGLIAVSK